MKDPPCLLLFEKGVPVNLEELVTVRSGEKPLLLCERISVGDAQKVYKRELAIVTRINRI